MSKYILHHEAEDCVGCHACEIHCKTNKSLGPGPSPCQIVTVPQTGHPRARFVFMPCFHCEDAWCLAACPTRAVQRRDKDGIVSIEASLCIGCKSCMAACPWGAPQWDPVTKKAVKCDYCKDRLDVGLQPACVTKCLTGCLTFGEAADIQDGRRERAAAALSGMPAAARP
jgi:Fe-S-cluster-containing dehydrogenase component